MRYPRHTFEILGTPNSAQELEESSIQPVSSREENWFPGYYWTGRPTFHKHFKRSLPWAISMWEGLFVSCLKCNGPRETLNQKKARLPWSGLNAGSSFISQDEGMSESSVVTLEKTLVPRLILTGALKSVDTLRGSWSSMLQRWWGLTLLENW